MKASEFFAPGKLFIAGEYTVLHHGLALLLPLKLGIHVSIQPSSTWRIHNPSFHQDPYECSTLTAMPPSVIQRTLLWFEQYLRIKNLTLHPCTITIESSLSTQAEKYGLGSSGAIIIALLGSFAKAYDCQWSPLQLFQAGVHIAYQNNRLQSFADLAVSAYQIPIQYRAPSLPLTDWPISRFDDVISTLWIEPWQFPYQHPWVVFTMQSSDSQVIVPKIMNHFTRQAWDIKVKEADTIIKHIIKQPTLDAIASLNDFLMTLDVDQHMYTPSMHSILTIAQHHHAVAKPSGAGGGDCMLVWPTLPTNLTLLKQDLEKQFKILSVF